MTHSVEETYRELGDLIDAAIEQDWEEAKIVCEKAGGAVFDFHGFYRAGTDSEPQRFTVGPQIAQKIMAVRRQIAGHDLPVKMVFTISHKGAFKIDVSY